MICSNLQCFGRKDTVLSSHDLSFLLIKSKKKDTVLSSHDLAFLLIKSKKNYKSKFSTNLTLKKTNKDNLGRKKTHEEKCCSN